MRVDELAAAVGLTVRNLRSLNERGLLPPPEVRGRVGYYGRDHVDRVRLIQSLQKEGLKLDGVKRLLERANTDSAALRRVRAAALQEGDAVVIKATELSERFDASPEDARSALEAAIRLRVLVPLEGGLLEVPSPALIDAAEAVVRSGMTLPTALRVVEEVGDQARAMAKIFVQAFVEDVWSPFAAAGMPEDGWPLFADAIEQTRPLAAQVAEAVLRSALDDEIHETLAMVSSQIAKES